MREILETLENFSSYEPQFAFYYGVATTLILILFIILLVVRLNNNCKGIMLKGERGNLFITSTAVEDFIIRLLADREELIVDKVRLIKKGRNYVISLYARFTSETSVTELRPLIEERILSNTAKRLGVPNIVSVNLLLKNFSAKERQIKSRNKLAMKDHLLE